MTSLRDKYVCPNEASYACADTCTTLEECDDCNCAVLPASIGGDWGEVMDVFFCLLPIMFLVYTTIKPNPLPTTTSLPAAALLMYLVRLMYLQSDPLLATGSIILGLHEALTPLSIMAGAITLFESMEATYCLPYMMREIKALTAGHPIAEAMLIFCFAYMVEGASGFGTPAALGAPMLVSVGHPPMESVVTLLIFNTFATVWGAVGTPIWFGFGSLGLSDDEYSDISRKAAACLAVGGVILIPAVLTLLTPWSVVRSNLMFIFLSLITCVGPSVAIAFVSYEFPSLIGGIAGCMGTALLIQYKVGLAEFTGTKGRNGSSDTSGSIHKEEESSPVTDNGGNDISPVNNSTGEEGQEEVLTDDLEQIELGEEQKDNDDDDDTDNDLKNNQAHQSAAGAVETEAKDINEEIARVEAALGPRKSFSEGYLSELLLRTFPIWGVVLLLILTRVEQIGIKEHLQKREPYFDIHFGTWGTFRLSSAVVFQLRDILGYPGLNWKYELFYVPFVLPFVAVSAVIIFIYRNNLATSPVDIFRTVTSRLRNPAVALFGALALVQLLIRSGDAAPANILGTILSDWFKEAFVVLTPLLGALGSFFSGSTTVSNLTFGDIQVIAAESIGVSKTSILALQAVGASAGNGICLNNIIAACAVVGLNIGEGQILMKTYKFVFANTTIATIIMLALFIRFD